MRIIERKLTEDIKRFKNRNKKTTLSEYAHCDRGNFDLDSILLMVEP
jgi:hypothetical protein